MMTSPPRAHDAVQAEVETLLGRSRAFQALPREEQRRLAADMVKVGGYLADKGWLEHRPPTTAAALGQDPVEKLKARLAEKPGQVDFSANAVKQGTQAFGELVQKVDFPKFVAGLVQGVFQAIVDASIQQMSAFGELLSATAKTVDQFASDHVTDAQARDFIANKYPSAVRVDTSGSGPARLRPGENPDSVDLGKAFQLREEADLTDDDSEQRLVGAAKVEMARQKQQTLATMMLLGINRIVVTNGKINAKVVFDVQASDAAKRHAKAELNDQEKTHVEVGGGFLGMIGGGFGFSHDHSTTVTSAVDDQSEARASLKAQLSGDVQLAFKSETFPLERMVDVMGLQSLNDKSQMTPPAAGARPPAGGAK